MFGTICNFATSKYNFVTYVCDGQCIFSRIHLSRSAFCREVHLITNLCPEVKSSRSYFPPGIMLWKFLQKFSIFRAVSPFSQHFFREFRCCEKEYHRCIRSIKYYQNLVCLVESFKMVPKLFNLTEKNLLY